MLFALWRRLPRVLRPFLAALAALSICFVLEVSAFASLPSVARIEERNLFYLAPLLLIALLVWIDQGLPRPPLAAGVAAVVAAALPGLIPYERLIGVPSQSDTLMLLPLWRVHERWTVALGDLAAIVLVLATVAAIAFLVIPRRFALVFPLAVLAFFLAVARPISARMEYAALGALAEGMNTKHRDWIDRAVAGRGEVAALWTGNTSRFSIWQNEFFNRSVGPVYWVRTPMSGGLPTTGLTLDPATGLLRDPDGRLVRTPFALTDGSAEVAGRVIASDPRRGVFLYELDGPLRQTAIVEGLHPNDTWSGPAVTYRRLSCDGREADRGAAERPEPLPDAVDGDARRVAARVLPRTGASTTSRSRSDRSTASARSRSRSRLPSCRATATCAGSDSTSTPSATRPDDGSTGTAIRLCGGCKAARCRVLSRARTFHVRALPASLHRLLFARRRTGRGHGRAMRIVVDVSPLSHPRTGIGNYIRGMLDRPGRGGRGRRRRVCAGERARRAERSRRRSTAIPIERHLRTPAGRRTAGARRGRRCGARTSSASSATSTSSTSPTGCTSRSAPVCGR